MPLFKSFRSKSSLKSSSSVAGNDDRDVSMDFGPRATSYGGSKGRNSSDQVRSGSAKRSTTGVAPNKLRGLSTLPTATESRGHAGRNGNANATTGSATAASSASAPRSDAPYAMQSQPQQPAPTQTQKKGYSSHMQPMHKAMSSIDVSSSNDFKPRPSDLFAGKGVQWDSVKLAGPGSALAEQNRPAAGSTNDDLQHFLKMCVVEDGKRTSPPPFFSFVLGWLTVLLCVTSCRRRQWKPQFAGTEDANEAAARFQPPKDLSKLSFGTPETSAPSRGLMSIDDLDKSHARKQKLLDDHPLGEGLLAEPSKTIKAASPSSTADLKGTGAAAGSSKQTPPTSTRPGLGSAFSFTRKGSSASAKRQASIGSTREGGGKRSAPPTAAAADANITAVPAIQTTTAGNDSSVASGDRNIAEVKVGPQTGRMNVPDRSSSFNADPRSQKSQMDMSTRTSSRTAIGPDATTNGHAVVRSDEEPLAAVAKEGAQITPAGSGIAPSDEAVKPVHPAQSPEEGTGSAVTPTAGAVEGAVAETHTAPTATDGAKTHGGEATEATAVAENASAPSADNPVTTAKVEEAVNFAAVKEQAETPGVAAAHKGAVVAPQQ